MYNRDLTAGQLPAHWWEEGRGGGDIGLGVGWGEGWGASLLPNALEVWFFRTLCMMWVGPLFAQTGSLWKCCLSMHMMPITTWMQRPIIRNQTGYLSLRFC